MHDLFLQSFDYCMRCTEQNVHRKLLPIKTFTAWIVDFFGVVSLQSEQTFSP